MKKIYRKINGFTLVEIILYIALTTIFLTGVVYFTWDLIYGRVKSYIQQEVNQNARLAGKRIIYEIRNASNINWVTPSSISLANSDASRNPTIVSLSDGRIKIGFTNSGSCPITNPCNLTSNQVNIKELTFKDLTSGELTKNIKFTFTIESLSTRLEFQKEETYESTVELRSN